MSDIDPWAVPPATPIDHPGAEIMMPNATGLEKALADVDAERIMRIYAELIIEQWRPWSISITNLPFLAWAMGVNFWCDDWLEHTKREWTARQWEFKSLRGTDAGLEMALDFAGRDFTQGGYELLQVLAPPQGFYASPQLSKEEWDAWIRLMPQIRIKFASYTGYGDDEFFAEPEEEIPMPPGIEPGEDIPDSEGTGGDGFCNFHFSGRDDGPALYGRKAVLRHADGTDTPLRIVEWVDRTVTVPTTTIGRASTVGEADALSGFWAEPAEEGLTDGAEGTNGFGSFCGDNVFVDFDLKTPELISYRIDSSYEHTLSDLHLDYITPGMEPIDVRYERDSDVGVDTMHAFFANDLAGDPDGAYADKGLEAAEMLADRIYLYDPAIAIPMMKGISFAGVDHIAIPAYHADLLVDLHTTDVSPAWYADESFLGETFAIPEDGGHIDRACKAICAAKAFRDKLAVSFEATVPLMSRDLDSSSEQTRFGDQRRPIL